MTTVNSNATRVIDPSLFEFDPEKVPKHVAIIMDGNRRWSDNIHLPLATGYWEGAEVLTHIVQSAIRFGITTLTVYAFSTENWSRSEEELEILMNLFEIFLRQKKDLMVQEGIRLGSIGDLSKFPLSVQQAFHETSAATQDCQQIHLVLALNYGARDEILRAVQRVLLRHDEKKISPNELTEDFFSQYLDTHPWGDPDLLIRTSGEFRISNFLLWQISYTELYVTDTLWPNFTETELLKAIVAYQARTRRHGG